MKNVLKIFIFLLSIRSSAQTSNAPNIFIITTDGFRWQEVFNGADSSLINNPAYVKDTGLMKQLYWNPSSEERRKLAMPFFWNVIAKQGQLYGNRAFENFVDVKNIYKISYPGYNELLTGYSDLKPILNFSIYNSNYNILEYLNELPQYKNKVAAFTSWKIFPFILNKKRNHLLLNSGWHSLPNDSTDNETPITEVQNAIQKKGSTRQDALTYLISREYIQQNHPKVVFLSFGETDEFAHHKEYDHYLQQATNVDKMISELWYYTQTDPFYKNNTTFLITTDHGRGSASNNWYTHNTFVKGSGQTWLAILGAHILPIGESRKKQQLFQVQIASTIASLIGETFPYAHAKKPIKLPMTVSGIPTFIANNSSFTKGLK